MEASSRQRQWLKIDITLPVHGKASIYLLFNMKVFQQIPNHAYLFGMLLKRRLIRKRHNFIQNANLYTANYNAISHLDGRDQWDPLQKI